MSNGIQGGGFRQAASVSMSGSVAGAGATSGAVKIGRPTDYGDRAFGNAAGRPIPQKSLGERMVSIQGAGDLTNPDSMGSSGA